MPSFDDKQESPGAAPGSIRITGDASPNAGPPTDPVTIESIIKEFRSDDGGITRHDFSDDFMYKLEGNRADFYHPGRKYKNSGVTVAAGFDLGHKNLYDLEKRYKLPPEIVTKLKPYLGIKGYKDSTSKIESQRKLEQPTSLTEQEVALINAAVFRHTNDQSAKRINGYGGRRWAELRQGERDALAAAYHQYGEYTKNKHVIAFEKAVAGGNVKAAQKALFSLASSRDGEFKSRYMQALYRMNESYDKEGLPGLPREYPGVLLPGQETIGGQVGYPSRAFVPGMDPGIGDVQPGPENLPFVTPRNMSAHQAAPDGGYSAGDILYGENIKPKEHLPLPRRILAEAADMAHSADEYFPTPHKIANLLPETAMGAEVRQPVKDVLDISPMADTGPFGAMGHVLDAVGVGVDYAIPPREKHVPGGIHWEAPQPEKKEETSFRDATAAESRRMRNLKILADQYGVSVAGDTEEQANEKIKNAMLENDPRAAQLNRFTDLLKELHPKVIVGINEKGLPYARIPSDWEFSDEEIPSDVAPHEIGLGKLDFAFVALPTAWRAVKSVAPKGLSSLARKSFSIRHKLSSFERARDYRYSQADGYVKHIDEVKGVYNDLNNSIHQITMRLRNPNLSAKQKTILGEEYNVQVNRRRELAHTAATLESKLAAALRAASRAEKLAMVDTAGRETAGAMIATKMVQDYMRENPDAEAGDMLRAAAVGGAASLAAYIRSPSMWMMHSPRMLASLAKSQKTIDRVLKNSLNGASDPRSVLDPGLFHMVRSSDETANIVGEDGSGSTYQFLAPNVIHGTDLRMVELRDVIKADAVKENVDPVRQLWLELAPVDLKLNGDVDWDYTENFLSEMSLLSSDRHYAAIRTAIERKLGATGSLSLRERGQLDIWRQAVRNIPDHVKSPIIEPNERKFLVSRAKIVAADAARDPYAYYSEDARHLATKATRHLNKTGWNGVLDFIAFRSGMTANEISEVQNIDLKGPVNSFAAKHNRLPDATEMYALVSEAVQNKTIEPPTDDQLAYLIWKTQIANLQSNITDGNSGAARALMAKMADSFGQLRSIDAAPAEVVARPTSWGSTGSMILDWSTMPDGQAAEIQSLSRRSIEPIGTLRKAAGRQIQGSKIGLEPGVVGLAKDPKSGKLLVVSGWDYVKDARDRGVQEAFVQRVDIDVRAGMANKRAPSVFVANKGNLADELVAEVGGESLKQKELPERIWHVLLDPRARNNRKGKYLAKARRMLNSDLPFMSVTSSSADAENIFNTLRSATAIAKAQAKSDKAGKRALKKIIGQDLKSGFYPSREDAKEIIKRLGIDSEEITAYEGYGAYLRDRQTNGGVPSPGLSLSYEEAAQIPAKSVKMVMTKREDVPAGALVIGNMRNSVNPNELRVYSDLPSSLIPKREVVTAYPITSANKAVRNISGTPVTPGGSLGKTLDNAIPQEQTVQSLDASPPLPGHYSGPTPMSPMHEEDALVLPGGPLHVPSGENWRKALDDVASPEYSWFADEIIRTTQIPKVVVKGPTVSQKVANLTNGIRGIRKAITSWTDPARADELARRASLIFREIKHGETAQTGAKARLATNLARALYNNTSKLSESYQRNWKTLSRDFERLARNRETAIDVFTAWDDGRPFLHDTDVYTADELEAIRKVMTDELDTLRKHLEELDPDFADFWRDNYAPTHIWDMAESERVWRAMWESWKATGVLNPKLPVELQSDNFWKTGQVSEALFSQITERMSVGTRGRSKKAFLGRLQTRPEGWVNFREMHDAGFRPITYNLVELFELKVRQAENYIVNARILQEYKKAGLVRRFTGKNKKQNVLQAIMHDETPWVSVDSSLRGMTDSYKPGRFAEYYAHPSVAKILDNYNAKGLYGSENRLLSSTARRWQKANMTLNNLQLGLSPFHVGVGAVDTMIGGLQQSSRKTRMALKALANPAYRRQIKESPAGYTPGKLMREAVRDLAHGTPLGVGASPKEVYHTILELGGAQGVRDNDEGGLDIGFGPLSFSTPIPIVTLGQIYNGSKYGRKFVESMDKAILKILNGVARLDRDDPRAIDFVLGTPLKANGYDPIFTNPKNWKSVGEEMDELFLGIAPSDQYRPEIKFAMEYVAKANGRGLGLPEDYFGSQTSAVFQKAINRAMGSPDNSDFRNFLDAALGAKDVATKAVMRRGWEKMTSWMFERMVPSIKMAAFKEIFLTDVANAGAASSDDVLRMAQDAWDVVDDRMGMMVMDNLHLHRRLRDVLHSTMRAVGWNYGTLRVVAGGAKDIAEGTYKLATAPVRAAGRATGNPTMAAAGARQSPKYGTQRGAYFVTLMVQAALMAQAYEALRFGDYDFLESTADTWEEKVRRIFFPRSGFMHVSGMPDRLIAPGYFKDAFSLMFLPFMDTLNGDPGKALSRWGEALGHKASPMIGFMTMLGTGQDYWGNELWDDRDLSVIQGVQRLASAGLATALPFGVTNLLEQKNKLVGVKNPGQEAVRTFMSGWIPAGSNYRNTRFMRMVAEKMDEKGFRDGSTNAETLALRNNLRKAKQSIVNQIGYGIEPSLEDLRNRRGLSESLPKKRIEDQTWDASYFVPNKEGTTLYAARAMKYVLTQCATIPEITNLIRALEPDEFGQLLQKAPGITKDINDMTQRPQMSARELSEGTPGQEGTALEAVSTRAENISGVQLDWQRPRNHGEDFRALVAVVRQKKEAWDKFLERAAVLSEHADADSERAQPMLPGPERGAAPTRERPSYGSY
tara:strand:- start:5129 stop:13309 length:8181 start_codon:yes stop_codon:yes gene_type:complete